MKSDSEEPQAVQETQQGTTVWVTGIWWKSKPNLVLYLKGVGSTQSSKKY